MKTVKDIIGALLIVISISWLCMAFTVAFMHDYYGAFQYLNNSADCFFPFMR